MTLQADIAPFSAGNAAGIGYLRRQSGPQPMVLLHGIGSNARSFERLAAALPSRFDVIAWNAPGYAGTQALAKSAPSPRDYADTLGVFLDTLGLKRIFLAGHSLGSLFAASFASTYPARVSALAMLSPAIGYCVPSGAALPPGVQSRIDELEQLGPAAFAAKRAARLVGDPARRPDIVATVERAMAAIDPSGYAQAVHALGAGDLLADAKRIVAPTLVAVGTRDVITPPDNARAVKQALRAPASYHEIDGAGHALPQEEPDATARLLAQWAEVHADG